MNIFAIENHKVKCCTLSAGYDHDKDTAKKYLTVGETYTIDKTNVDGWYTDVYLKEFPDVRFNSVFFEDETEQSDLDDKKHPDYSKYN